MAITFVGSATNSVTNGNTITLNLSSISGLAEGDIVLAFGLGSSGTPSRPTGYTSIIDGSLGAENDLKYSMSYKVQTSSVDTTLTFWDPGGTDDSGTAIALAFRGINTTTPLDVTSESDEWAVSPTLPPITPVSADCCIVVFSGGNWEDTSVGTVTNYSTPVTIASGDNNDTTAAAVYRMLSGGAGVEEDPGTFSTWSGASQVGVGITIALRPAASEGQPFYSRDIILFPSGGISII